MRVKSKLFVFMLLILASLCCTFGLATLSKNANTIAKAETNSNVTEHSIDHEDTCFMDGDYVSFESNERAFTEGENVVADFKVYSDSNIISYDYEQSGYDTVSINQMGNNIHMELSVQSDYLCSCISVIIKLSSSNNLVATLYAINNEYGTFISPFSEDDAYESFYGYALLNGYMSEEQCDLARNERIKLGVSEKSSGTNSSSVSEVTAKFNEESYTLDENNSGISLFANTDTYVKGHITWIDDNGVTHPLIRSMVRIYDKEPIGDTHIGTVYTDYSGNYSFTFQNKDGFWDFENGGLDIFVRIYAGTTNTLVKNADGNDYYYESSVSENVSTGSTTTRNLTIGMSTDFGRACQISQALIMARDYVWNMTGSMPADVSLRYPSGSNGHYTRDEKTIYLTGNASIGSSPNSYASWDVVMHEYGHHIQYEMGIINSPHGNHSSGQNNADIRGSKDIGVRLAWAEAWPTVFGTVAQNYWRSYLPNIDTVADTSYTSYNGLDYDIESTDVRLGEACERSIMAVLWDIYDSNSDNNDTISIGAQSFWNITATHNSITFSDFINSFYEIYPQYTDNIGANLTYYRMAATAPIMSNSSSVSQTIPPRFTWTPQGGSTNYPNNRFRIVFYDSTGSIAFKTAYTSSNSYTLTQSEWDSVLHTYGKTYKVAVAAAQTNDYVTGEYISLASSTFTKPTSMNLSESVTFGTNSRYTERITNLQPGQYVDYTIRFSAGGRKLIQTFGTKDTVIYLFDSNGVQLMYDNDSGYEKNAAISYQFTQDVSYTLRVKFYSSSQAGQIKTTFVPQTKTSSLYESFFEGPDNWSGHSGSLSSNNSVIVRYNANITKNVTFTTDCDFDAYLYVIDPRSTDAIGTSSGSDSVYNDDGAGNRQAKITKQLEANIPYLVILTAYNPSTQSGSFKINFTY